VAKNSSAPQAAEARVECRDEGAVGHEPAVRRCEAGRDAADGAREAAEYHRRPRRGQAQEARRHRRADHDEDRLDEAGGDRQRHDLRAGADRGARDRTDDVGDGAGADRRHADGVAVAEGPRHAGAHDEREQGAEDQRDGAHEAGLLRFHDLDFERGGDDGEVAQHGPTHQAHAGEQRDVGEAALAARLDAAPVGEAQADEDGDGGAVHAAQREAARHLHRYRHDEAHEGEGHDEAIVLDGFFQEFEHDGLLRHVAWRRVRWHPARCREPGVRRG
jgi:hypothetical protein